MSFMTSYFPDPQALSADQAATIAAQFDFAKAPTMPALNDQGVEDAPDYSLFFKNNAPWAKQGNSIARPVFPERWLFGMDETADNFSALKGHLESESNRGYVLTVPNGRYLLDMTNRISPLSGGIRAETPGEVTFVVRTINCISSPILFSLFEDNWSISGINIEIDDEQDGEGNYIHVHPYLQGPAFYLFNFAASNVLIDKIGFYGKMRSDWTEYKYEANFGKVPNTDDDANHVTLQDSVLEGYGWFALKGNEYTNNHNYWTIQRNRMKNAFRGGHIDLNSPNGEGKGWVIWRNRFEDNLRDRVLQDNRGFMIACFNVGMVIAENEFIGECVQAIHFEEAVDNILILYNRGTLRGNGIGPVSVGTFLQIVDESNGHEGPTGAIDVEVVGNKITHEGTPGSEFVNLIYSNEVPGAIPIERIRVLNNDAIGFDIAIQAGTKKAASVLHAEGNYIAGCMSRGIRTERGSPMIRHNRFANMVVAIETLAGGIFGPNTFFDDVQYPFYLGEIGNGAKGHIHHGMVRLQRPDVYVTVPAGQQVLIDIMGGVPRSYTGKMLASVFTASGDGEGRNLARKDIDLAEDRSLDEGTVLFNIGLDDFFCNILVQDGVFYFRMNNTTAEDLTVGYELVFDGEFLIQGEPPA